MPITIAYKTVGTQCVDHEFVINNQDVLADEICKLLMGQCNHVIAAINGLTMPQPSLNETAKIALKCTIAKLKKRSESDVDLYKVDGWLFQMISWLVLVKQHKGEKFFLKNPHLREAMHGFDGLAVKLTDANSIDKIIITEDKCTENSRSTIKNKVFPEFLQLEQGDLDYDIFQEIGALISSSLKDDFYRIQDNIMDHSYRQYRICITRQNIHNTDRGRAGLYKEYNNIVSGANIDRRTASSICLNDKEREWMADLHQRVVQKLEVLVQ